MSEFNTSVSPAVSAQFPVVIEVRSADGVVLYRREIAVAGLSRLQVAVAELGVVQVDEWWVE